MLKDHPKGLLVAFFTNMGERFGFLYHDGNPGHVFTGTILPYADEAGSIYSWFYFAIYALALIGGMIADWTKKYKSGHFAWTSYYVCRLLYHRHIRAQNFGYPLPR